MKRVLELLFPKRVGPLSFVVRLFLMAVIFRSGIYGIRQLPENSRLLDVAAFLFIMTFILYVSGFVFLPRVRDFGLPRLATLLLLVPMINILLAICLLFLPENYWSTLWSGVRRWFRSLRGGR